MSENIQTLLGMTQSILSSLDFDVVNSINDTPEAYQIALTIQEAYFNILRRKPWSWLDVINPLSTVADVAQPTKIQIPLGMNRVDKLKYNVATKSDTQNSIIRFQDLDYMYPDEFLDMAVGRVPDGVNLIITYMDNGTPLVVQNNIPPSYWTCFDENFIYFDAWDSSQTTTIVGSYTLAYGAQEPSWTQSDAFVPVLPQSFFSLLLETARAVCAERFRQLPDKHADNEAMKQYNTARLNEHKIRGGMRFYNFGRMRVR